MMEGGRCTKEVDVGEKNRMGRNKSKIMGDSICPSIRNVFKLNYNKLFYFLLNCNIVIIYLIFSSSFQLKFYLYSLYSVAHFGKKTENYKEKNGKNKFKSFA